MIQKRVLLLVLLAILCGVAISRLFGNDARIGPMQELARMRPERAFAARVSIPTEYHECTAQHSRPADTLMAVTSERCVTSDERPLRLGRLAAVENSSTDPDSLQASALAAIIWPQEANPHALDGAITRLNRALRLSTRRVPLLVDLSAAHLAVAEPRQNPYDILLAAHYAAEALALEPRNKEALFNFALANQAFGLDEEADRAWDAYLAIDSTSRWADEARIRQQALITDPPKLRYPAPGAPAADVVDFARRDPQEAREHGFDTVLGQWGKAVEEGDAARAAAHLELAERLGHALEQRGGGDASVAEAVRAIRRAQPIHGSTLVLARAHRQYAQGRADGDQLKVEAAAEAFTRVVRARPASPVLGQWATLYQVMSRYAPGRVGRAEAVAELSTLLAHVDSMRYPALTGRAGLALGTILLHAQDPAAAREQFQSAEAHFARAGEAKYRGAVLSTRGEVAYAQGDTGGAYRDLYGAQRVLRSFRDSQRLHNQLHGLARCAALDGLSRAALAILNENVRVATREGTTIRLVDALQARARVLSAIGDTRGAARDLDSAYALLAAMPKEQERGLHRLATATLGVARPAGISATELDSAVATFESNAMWLTDALLRRADSRLRDGNLSGAAEDLERVTNGVRGLTIQLANTRLRGAALEQARSRFDRLVMLNLRRGRPVDALGALERGRLSFATQREGEATAGDVHLAAPPGHVAVEYALIGDTLLAWTIRGDTIRVLGQPVDRDTFMLTVDQVVAALESPVRAASANAGLRRLYDWLIRPIRGYLGPPGTPLVVLADGEVAGVPFGALLDEREDYLIERHPLRHAPTLADAARPAPPRTGSGLALLVADPAFDGGEYPMLDPLEGARREVDSLLPLYGTHVRLQGDSATLDAFLENARSASLIHYAGHAVFDDARPERSYLVLAGADTTGRLTAEAVSTLKLDGVGLVVLSACRTLRSREGRSGGFAGLSAALLTAGAGGVVGSLWEVSDEMTHPLMQAFHEEYRRSGDPARALRAAQLRMLASGGEQSSPAAWAGFRYTGAGQP